MQQYSNEARNEMNTHRSPIFTDQTKVPEVVGQLGLMRFDPSDDPDRGSIFRYEAETEGDGWLGANVFLYDRGFDLRDGADQEEVAEERDSSFKRLRANAIEPTTIGVAPIKCQMPGGQPVDWQWACLRSSPNTDAEITHVAIRVDGGYFNKVLYTYPASIDSIGRVALVEFLDDWHRAVT